jgi:hypothetical protein
MRDASGAENISASSLYIVQKLFFYSGCAGFDQTASTRLKIIASHLL